MEVTDAINSAAVIGKYVLFFFLIVALMKSALSVYARIVRGEEQQPLTSITNWLRAVIFILIALGVLHGLQVSFNESLSGLDQALRWAQAALFIAFFVVFVSAIIQVVNSEGHEFKGNLQRFGVGLVFILLSFGIVSVFVELGSTTTSLSFDLSLDATSDFIDVIVYSFKKTVYYSGLIEGFFFAVGGVCAVFFIWKTISNFKNITNGKRVDIWELSIPIVLTLIVLSWSSIYQNLDEGFDLVERKLISKLHQTNSDSAGTPQTLKSMMQEMVSGVSGLIFSTMPAIFTALLGCFLVFVNYLVDLIVTLYSNISIFVMVLLAPVALLMSYTNNLESLKVWAKIWFKYKFFTLFPLLLNFLGVSFLINFTNAKNQHFSTTLSAVSALPGVDMTMAVYAFLAFIVVKVIFCIVAYKVLDQLIGTQGVGLGSAVGGAFNTGKTVVAAAAV